METRKGRIKKVQHVNGFTSLDAMIMEVVKELDAVELYEDYLEDLEDVDDAFNEVLFDTDCDKYKILDGDLYEVLEDLNLGEYFCEMNNNEDGSISYITSFYNGGAYIDEVLERGVKNLTTQKTVVY